MAHQTFTRPAIFFNTRMVLYNRIPIPSGTLDLPSSFAPTVSTETHQRLSETTIAPAATAALAEVPLRKIGQTNDVPAPSDTTTSSTGHIRFSNLTFTGPTTARVSRCLGICSEEPAPIHEYFHGHTNEFGEPLGRTLTPCPKRRPREFDDDVDDIDDESEGSTTERHVSFSTVSSDMGSKLIRVPTPYAFDDGDGRKKCGGICGIKRWCRRIKRRLSR